MLQPDTIWSEVVADSDGSASALELGECRITVALVRAASLDGDFNGAPASAIA